MPTIDQFRSDLDELTRLASLDLAALWRRVEDATIARELLADILPELVDVYGSAAGTLAADWYDDLRAEQEIDGRFRALVADLPDRAQTAALAGWAVDAMFSAEPDPAAALTAAQGGLQRLIANVGRGTVADSAIADPAARGWQRSASGGCGFCRMLASRGAVYSKSTVHFGGHDHCRCVAVPAFEGRERPVKPYTPTGRDITDADRARTRAWMSEHGY